MIFTLHYRIIVNSGNIINFDNLFQMQCISEMNAWITKSEKVNTKGQKITKLLSERERERSFWAVNATVNAKKPWFTNALVKWEVVLQFFNPVKGLFSSEK